MCRALPAGLTLSGFLITGCTMLPSLEEATGGIPVYDIVLRTKCELSDAFTDDNGHWMVGNPGYQKLAWLENWTAQVDMTLQVLDQATFAPGASFMQPLHNAYPTAVGPSSISTTGVPGTTISGVSQSFAVAAGVSLNGQAQRTQTMSYVFSVKELKEWRGRTDTAQLCAVSDHMDLRGRLGLREWFRQAVWPVVATDELLYAGYHQKPGAGAAQAGPSKPQGATDVGGHALEKDVPCDSGDVEAAKQKLNTVQDTINAAVEIAKETEKPLATLQANAQTAQTSIKNAKKALAKAQMQYGPVLDPALRQKIPAASTSIHDADSFYRAASKSLNNATDEIKELTPLQETELTKAKDRVTTARDLISGKCMKTKLDEAVSSAVAHAEKAFENANAARANVEVANDDLKKLQTSLDSATEFTSKSIDPPVASIGQSVQFILAYGGNVTPTWTFVRFKGPNNPLFSTSGTRTHTLNVTIGPVSPGTNTPNSDVKTNQFYLQINSILAPLVP